ncbi:2-oxoisovalerate dehydrogenase E1 [Streptomyces parvus]|uniref:alpha-ketoacid dehydrogenase subunit alpha/beta n=1 Tax=Streptomyces parvus TaxID=66428 RepID=UPI0016752CAC|nr:alpha-ketoacid dehydrogenase subunit alpha/beta [Streptomyces parvus]GGS49176.1 2-oxoisovalerate dehydrogenase E1 [Streptomyces parvus]
MLSHTVQPFEPVSTFRDEPADYRRIGRSAFLRMLFDMRIVRLFETGLIERAARGEVTGPVHTAIGQEAVPAAVLRHLLPGDHVMGSHRAHQHFLVQSLAQTLDSAWDPLRDRFPEGAAKQLGAAFAEIMGLTTGVNHGAGGSMHLRDASVGFIGSTAIVGGGIPLASGLAFAHSLRGTDGCAVCFIGDGAVNQGTFHETANLARVLGLPLLIVVENNGYAEATRPQEVSAVLPLASQGAAHGLRAVEVSCDEPAALVSAAGALIDGVRRGDGPALLEVRTYRHLDHTGGRPGSAAGYRSAEEEAHWLRRDPLESLAPTLLREGLLAPGEERAVAEAAAAVTARIFEEVSTPEAAPPTLDPFALLRAPVLPRFGEDRPGRDTPGPARSDEPATELTFEEAIGEGLARALAGSPEVVLLGEEVGKPGGLLARTGRLNPALVGSRIIDTPITEASFVGLAGGAAMVGVRPVVELMYGSFALIAADQLFNHIGMVRALYGNTAQAPVIVRTKVPVGLGYGPQHGLNPVGLFASFPGWRVYAPADARDYLGVLRSALECDDPVLIVEFTQLYDEVLALTEADLTARLPLEGARRIRRGSDVSIVTYGLGVRWAIEAAELLTASGIDAEVVDLRALDTVAMDRATVEESVRRTGRGLFVDPAARGQAIGPRLVAELVERVAGLRLACLACADVQPVAHQLERQAVIGAADVVRAVERLVRNKRSGEAEQ